MKVGITGWKGFIGHNLRKYLEKSEYEVALFPVSMNIFNQEHVHLFVKDVDVVVHLAGKNRGTDENIVRSNVEGSLTFIKSCATEGRTLIYAGTDYNKESAYKLSKDTVENLMRSYDYLGLNSTYLTIPKVYGPGCKPYYNSFVSTLLYIHSRGELNKYKYLIKDLNEKIELIHVNDLCESIMCVIKNNFSGFTQYMFNKHDGVINVTFKEILDKLEFSDDNVFKDVSRWYKENEV